MRRFQRRPRASFAKREARASRCSAVSSPTCSSQVVTAYPGRTERASVELFRRYQVKKEGRCALREMTVALRALCSRTGGYAPSPAARPSPLTPPAQLSSPTSWSNRAEPCGVTSLSPRSTYRRPGGSLWFVRPRAQARYARSCRTRSSGRANPFGLRKKLVENRAPNQYAPTWL